MSKEAMTKPGEINEVVPLSIGDILERVGKLLPARELYLNPIQNILRFHMCYSQSAIAPDDPLCPFYVGLGQLFLLLRSEVD